MTPAILLLLALLLDLLVGEFPNRIHPVAWGGRGIAILERAAPVGRTGRFLYGLLLAFAVPTAAVAATWGLMRGLAGVPWFQGIVAVLLLKSTFALRALGRAAARVREGLASGRTDAARAGLASLCSREAGSLDDGEIAAAAIESVAENASDSFVAPIFGYVLFGLPGAVAYRAVNTLDAMLGYRNERYEWLGKASARLDDLFHLVPARLTAGLLLLAALPDGRAVARGFASWRRDARRTASPNAGHPMAAMAGLLGVRLAKPDGYVLGESGAVPSSDRIEASWRAVRAACLFGTGLAVVILEGIRAWA